MFFLILILYVTTAWTAHFIPCQQELDSFLSKKSIPYLNLETPTEVISRERTIQAIKDVQQMKAKAEEARTLDERMRLNSMAHQIAEKYLNTSTRDFTGLWGMEFDSNAAVNFDEHRVYELDGKTTFRLYSHLGSVLGTSWERGDEILVNSYDQNCEIEFLKLNVELGIHQGARYQTRLKLHRNLCRKLLEAKLPNDYSQLLDFMKANRSSAVFLEHQTKIIKDLIVFHCNVEAELMGLSNLRPGN